MPRGWRERKAAALAKLRRRKRVRKVTMVSSTGMRVGDNKGYPVEKLAKVMRPKHRKGVSSCFFPGMRAALTRE